MRHAKLPPNGQSQAVQLPKGFRFKGDSVTIKRIRKAAILLPGNEPWDALFTFRMTLWKNRNSPPWMFVRNFDESSSRHEYLHLHD